MSDAPLSNSDEALDFLNNFHPSGPWHLASMVPDQGLVAKTLASEEALRLWIDQHQGKANLYFHVNEVRGDLRDAKAKKADVVAVRALHVDVDDLGGLERIQAFEPGPTAVVFSGGGYQAFWLLRDASKEIDRAERCNAALASRLGGDNCQNVDRLMRVPGTINLPNRKKKRKGRAPTLARLVEADWSRRYELAEFPAEDLRPSAATVITAAPTGPVVPVHPEELPKSISDDVRRVIEFGDDPGRPRGSEGARYPSRSEAVFYVACALAKAGCTNETIAGVLTNPGLGISQSVLERRDAPRYALKQAAAARAAVGDGWPDADRHGRPRPTMRNTAVALRRLELVFEYDVFRHRKMMSGQALEEHQGEISDDACIIMRGLIVGRFGFDPKSENIRDAVNLLCLEHARHPIREMLDGLRWDGVSRIDRWLTKYLGADDTPLNRAIGPIMLIAAVRRIRQPGVKFDQIVVLEGEQGSGKSSALRILAGPGNHSDQEILTLDAKQQMELMEGVWIYELGEVEGLNRAEVNKS